MSTVNTKPGHKAGNYFPLKPGQVFASGRPPRGTTPRKGGPPRATGPGSINCKAEIQALWNARRFGAAADLAAADRHQCGDKTHPVMSKAQIANLRKLHEEYPS